VRGDTLDLVLLGVVVIFAISGFQEGLLVGFASTVGFIGGALLGTQLAPAIADAFNLNHSALVGLVVVFLSATLGQVLLATLGGMIRRRVTWHPAQTVDSLGGALLSVARVLLLAYLVGVAVFQSPYRTFARQVSRSQVLAAVGTVVPDAVPNALSDFIRLFGRDGFPQVFAGLGSGSTTAVAPPDPALVNSRAVAVARTTVVRVRGDAPSCRRSLEGSGFLFARDHVMTNAHVVAGVRSPVVDVGGNRTLDARVVLYDPVRDVAVLFVPGMGGAPLGFAGPANAGADAVVVGYPENGPFTAGAARVRLREPIHSPDIYGNGDATREVYAVRAIVRPGNSGGPLLASDGRVLGVVFAAATDDPETGYALTAQEVAPDATAGASAVTGVSTQGCD
jgi:S1-C subfamily serine protease